eukprot:gene2911-3345_t
MLAITETPNELTEELGGLKADGILRLLRQSDAQIFAGYKNYMSLNDDECLDEMTRIVEKVESLLNSDRTDHVVDVVVGGAGTSGRLAFFLARVFNNYTESIGKENQIKFHYLMAGGDHALNVGIEGAEDDVVASVQDISRQVLPGHSLVYIGITCGLSAPYVAAQLDYLMDLNHQDHVVCLLGLNPLELARSMPIERWDKSFKQVANRLDLARHNGRYFILCPVVGPEPLTGSTRMKSGSATKIILDVIFSTILNRDGMDTIKGTLATLISRVGKTLVAGGRLIYVASGCLGIVAFIDASETVPTFGSGPLDVRSFIMDNGHQSG